MTDTDRELSLQDEDRLPWLEAVDNGDDEEGISSGKLIGFVAAALLALAVVVGGVWWLRGQQQGPNGDGTLIAAAEGDYKVKPDEVGGMKVEGQGDAAFAASEGAEANGKVDLNAQPETPVAATKVTEVKPSAPAVVAAPTATAPVTSGGKLVAKPPVASAPGARPAVAAPMVNATPAAMAGTGLIQLGAYNSEATANQAWAALSQRYAFLGGMPKSIVPAAVGGTNFFRLRAQAGAQAGATCAKLKASGANCLVVK
jgi:SPOR domain